MAVLLALFGACNSPNTKAPVTMLPAIGDTLGTSYSEVTDAAWLAGNRWAVLAPSDNTVGLADFGEKKVTALGGERSKELRNPASLFVAGDTLFVGDWGLRRISVWTPAGRLVRSIPAPASLRGALPRARDLGQRFYAELNPSPGQDGSGNRDSAAVVRSDAQLIRADTIARLAPLDIAEVQGDAGRRFERRVFSGVDRWGVLPDGSLWIGRVYPNRVDWREPNGHWLRGQDLPDRVLEVTRYDRELFLRKFPPELRRTAQELPFAALKPPFEWATNDARGQVWLEKSRAPADSVRRYHVVDRRGQLVEEIHLQGQGRILAIGLNSAMVVVPSPHGVRLIRVPLPHQPSQ
ncbi:MAG TPA: hypothetical protein VFH40_09085 [Gemmatimonadales bacterium]|nr:hypothetical protein [Gemmatimonadales bacterium]